MEARRMETYTNLVTYRFTPTCLHALIRIRERYIRTRCFRFQTKNITLYSVESIVY